MSTKRPSSLTLSILVALALTSTLAGQLAHATASDITELRLAQLEAVARAALALPDDVEGIPSKARPDDLVWRGPSGNVEVVSAYKLAKLIGHDSLPARTLLVGSDWPFEAATQIRAARTDLADPMHRPGDLGARELLARLRYVIVVFEEEYEGPGFFGQRPWPHDVPMRFKGRAALFAMEDSRLLAYARLDATASRLKRDQGTSAGTFISFDAVEAPLLANLGQRTAEMVGASSWGGILDPMEKPWLSRPAAEDSRAPLVFALLGAGVLFVLMILLIRRWRRPFDFIEGVQVHTSTSEEGAFVTMEFVTGLSAELRWLPRPRDNAILSGDRVVDSQLSILSMQGPPLAALYAALTGAPLWRDILDNGGRITSTRQRLVVRMPRDHRVEQRMRGIAMHIRDLQGIERGTTALRALREDATTPPAARARIAIALARWAPGTAETRDMLERLGWTEPLEPHLVPFLTHTHSALVIDACDALASLGSADSLPALEQVDGPARDAAARAIAAIMARGGDPRQGALALSSGPAGALSVPRED